MVTESVLRISEVLWKVSSAKLTAGANMDDASGETKVMLERRPRRSHLREGAKFKGISGSSCPSHPTMPFSRSDSGILARASRSFLLRDVRAVAIRESLLWPLALVLVGRTSLPSSDFWPVLTDE